MFKKIIQFISLGNRVATILGKKLPALLAICSLWLLNCICLSLPLVLEVRCGFDCISSGVHLFTLLKVTGIPLFCICRMPDSGFMFTCSKRQHYENMPIQIYRRFHLQKLKKIQIKTPIFFIFLLKTYIVGTR